MNYEFKELDRIVGLPTGSSTTCCHIAYRYNGHRYRAEGYATCHPDDKFNAEFGEELAQVRANKNMLKHIEKLLLAETHKPEWKKKQKMSFEATFYEGIACHEFMPVKDINRILKETHRKFKPGSNVKVTIEEL